MWQNNLVIVQLKPHFFLQGGRLNSFFPGKNLEEDINNGDEVHRGRYIDRLLAFNQALIIRRD